MQTTRHQSAASATFAGFLDALRPKPKLGAPSRLDGKTVLLTGASRGLGAGIAAGLGALGAHVIVPLRSGQDETVAAITAAGGTARAMPVDLLDLASIDRLVDALAADGVRLDRVILNAGMVPSGSRVTGDGFDAMLQVNYLANVRLIDGLLRTGVLAPGDPAPRVVVVGSESHRSAPPIDLACLTTPRTYGMREVVAEYGRTKLMLHTWVGELAQRLDTPGPTIAVHHLCPGAVDSSIAREAPRWAQPLLGVVFRLAFQSPATAAVPVLWLAGADDVGARTGVYLHMTTRKQPSALAEDRVAAAALWTATQAAFDARR